MDKSLEWEIREQSSNSTTIHYDHSRRRVKKGMNITHWTYYGLEFESVKKVIAISKKNEIFTGNPTATEKKIKDLCCPLE